MSGAEAVFVVSLISNIISIIEAIKTVYDAARDAKGQPEAFRQVAARLPLVLEVLHSAEEKAQALDEAAQEQLEPIIESCKAKAENLNKIFQKVIRKDDDKWYDRYKRALSTSGKANKVECLMEGILKDIQVLVCQRLTGTATEAQVKEIREAINEMSEISSSLPDEAGGVVQTNRDGGDNFANVGSGNIYNYKAARDIHFGGNSIKHVINFSIGLQEDNQTQNCLRDLRITDPDMDKGRIEQTKGGLLEIAYQWILETSDFQEWRNSPQPRLLWIKGAPGKGKTMLLCGIVNNLEETIAKTDLLSYFFCQATDSRINNAIAVLRGLIYLILKQEPRFISHVRKKYDDAGEKLFRDENAWTTLTNIFFDILRDPKLQNIYLVVDALDECVTGLPALLSFIVQTTSFSNVKWILSSRHGNDIERGLQLDGSRIRLSLELKENEEQVSCAVNAYIDHCISKLAVEWPDIAKQNEVRDILKQKSNGTFLWVALVVQELEKAEYWDISDIINEVPIGLAELYRRMIEQIKRLERKYPEFCQQVLSTVITAYRPLHLQELHTLSSLPVQAQNIDQFTTTIVKKCGSFLTIRDGNVYIIHQSATDFLIQEAKEAKKAKDANHSSFLRTIEDIHHSIFSRSLQILSEKLDRNIYKLDALGYPIEKVQQPGPDPLSSLRYSCIYWVNHLYPEDPNICDYELNLQDESIVEAFMRQNFLYWLEALSLCKSMSQAVSSMARLDAQIRKQANSTEIKDLVRDARRFIMYHKNTIENNPLQVYASALLFSPARTRGLFNEENPEWITIQPSMDDWSACLQTLEGHSDWVWSVAFSHDSKLLASASNDKTIRIWKTSTGQCLHTLKGHDGGIKSVAFSHDSNQIASASTDRTVKIWDIHGQCLQTLKGHTGEVKSVVFSYDSKKLASASSDTTIKIWDPETGKCLRVLRGHRNPVQSVVFSYNSTQLASISNDNTIKIWNSKTGQCLRTLEDHKSRVRSVAFSSNAMRLASASNDQTIKIWDTNTGECLQTLKGHDSGTPWVAFKHNSIQLVSFDKSVKIWDPKTGQCLQALEGHSRGISSVAFSHDSMQLASASLDQTIKLWDISNGQELQMSETHSSSIRSVVFSHDSMHLASASNDKTIKIWNTDTGQCLQTLKGHSSSVLSVIFSHDSMKLISTSLDQSIKIWDITTGQCLQTFNGHNSEDQSVAFSHDSTKFASISSNTAVKTWEATSDDKTIKIWDARTGHCLESLEDHSSWIQSIVFSHDSMQLASASNDHTVKIWDINTGQCLQTLQGHSNIVRLVAFSRHSTQLASASLDKTVKLWDASTGECLQTFRIGIVLSNLSFGATDSCIHTDLGVINVNASSSNMTGSVTDPQYQGCGLSPDGNWITYDSKNVVLIPPEYRQSCSAVSDMMMGLGAVSGKVLICRFNAENFENILD